MTCSYTDFINSKRLRVGSGGLSIKESDIHHSLFDYQRCITRWALRKGKACVFAATGLGKTRIEIEFARLSSMGGGRSLIVAPLAVSHQIARECKKMMVNAMVVKSSASCALPGIYITNYEQLHNFDSSLFDAVVLDESSILKSYDGRTKQLITEMFARTKYKLACTATPAPNDHMELGTHCEFVGGMTRAEMLATYFVHDGGDTSKWRLKGHAVKSFWDYVSSWAVCVTMPSDLGFSDDGHVLPELRIHEHIVDGNYNTDGESLFHFGQMSATSVHKHLKETSAQRSEKVAEIANAHDTFLSWCNTNYDQDSLIPLIDSPVVVTGSDPPNKKESLLESFTDNGGRMITKPSIAGFGLNWQHCGAMAFCGLSYSWEQTHQAIRRCWRYGRKDPVDVHFVVADTESSIAETLRRKEEQFIDMKSEMREAMGRNLEEYRG